MLALIEAYEEMGLPMMLWPKDVRESIAQRKDAMMEDPVKWHPDIKWERLMCVESQSFLDWQEPYLLESPEDCPPGDVYKEKQVPIPGTNFYYAHVRLPRGAMLNNILGSKRGRIFFDEDVFFPIIRERNKFLPNQPEWTPDRVWMSSTPQEFFTLRAGTRLARGHVVIAGLGMGMQLLDVTSRYMNGRADEVTDVTVIERDDRLIECVKPIIEDKLRRKGILFPITYITADAYEYLPDYEADVALIDIFPKYGNNTFPECPDIKTVWIWGKAKLA